MEPYPLHLFDTFNKWLDTLLDFLGAVLVTKFGPMKGWHKYGGVRFTGVLFGPDAGLV